MAEPVSTEPSTEKPVRKEPIEFYFDFSSPYGYFAATRIGAIAREHGREVLWKPYLLGAVFKVTGGAPVPSIPLKGEYQKRDMERVSRLWRIPYKEPSRFPVGGQAPSRIVYWLQEHHPDKQEGAVLALFHAYFVEDRDISTPEIAADVVASLHLNQDELLAATQAPEMKERLRQECDAAIKKGVFGSPFIIVDGEPFWGADRLAQVEEWLETGGF
ncbi:MAG: 2-hydroxychromene-2-carboxylate isomerase [Betaproteobacteria bacterium]|nr:MAG: 2-hydroxychromene-2-carboxylate isomerase [Betaproteobacteria bacterium]